MVNVTKNYIFYVLVYSWYLLCKIPAIIHIILTILRTKKQKQNNVGMYKIAVMIII